MTEQQLELAEKEQNIFNGKKLLSRVIDHWYLYIIFLTAGIFYALFKVHYATPMYKVNAEVIVQDDKNSGTSQLLSGGSNSSLDFSSMFSGKTNIQNEIAILQTTDICRKVVNNLKLYIAYYLKGSVRTSELYEGSPFVISYHSDNDIIAPMLLELNFSKKGANSDFILKNGTKIIPWRFNDTLHYNNATICFKKVANNINSESPYLVSIQDPEAVAVNLAQNLSVDVLIQKSTVLNLTYNTNLPSKGEDVLNAIIKAYIERNLNEKNQTSDNSIQFITQRIAIVGNDLGNIEKTIQEFKQKNQIADLSTQSQELVTNSSGYLEKLNDISVQLQVVKTMLSYVQNEQNNRRPVPALLNTDPTFAALVTAYNAAQVQRDKVLLSVKEENPIITNINTQLEGMRGDMIQSLQSQQRALQISEQKIKSQNSQLNSLLYNVPVKERQFLDYSREQSLQQTLYLFLLQKREEIAIARASNSSNASIIESPRANSRPYEPSFSNMLAMGILLGLAIPTGFLFLKYSLNNKILNRADISDVSNTTVIAEIGHSRKEGLLDIKEEGRSIIAEQFRIFRTNMDFLLPGIKTPVIMVTSSISGEGKSFVAANLGQIYSISGKKVLMMELDLRKPKLSSMVNMTNDVGFTNYIISDNSIDDYIKKVNTSVNNLYILSAGPIPPNPAELLLSNRVDALLSELKKKFDIIIIDTAPIGAVADAQILGKYADVSLFIVRQRYSQKSNLQLVNDIVSGNKLPSLYIVANDVREGASYRYGYSYGARYGYSYDATETSKKRWWQRKK